MSIFKNTKIATGAIVALYGGLLLGLYYSTFTNLLKWWNKEEYNYCYLIPFVVLYLIWEKRDKLAGISSKPSWLGMIPVCLGILFFWLGELGANYFSLYLSFWFVTIGLCWIHLGWKKLNTISFALFFMLTMFPLPSLLNVKLMANLRLISSKAGVSLLGLYGLPVYRDGNIIDLGFAQLQIVEACSGLNSLISLSVLSLLLGYFFKGAFWKKAVLFVSAAPLAIGGNSLRIALTGVLYSVWGAKAAEGFFHGLSGLLIFVVALGIMLLEMWILAVIGPRRKEQGENRSGEFPEVLSGADGRQGKDHEVHGSESHERKGLLAPKFIAVVVLLVGTLAFAFARGNELQEKIPFRKPLTQFPVKIGQWTGAFGKIEDRTLDFLALSDYTNIEYTDKAGHEINLYIAYYESQSKGESIHSPEVCIPMSGWVFTKVKGTTLPAAGRSGGAVHVNRAIMQKAGKKKLVYHWFMARGRVLTHPYHLKFYNFWDAITQHRTDGALVRLIANIDDSEDLTAAERRLQAFAQKIIPLLDEFIPGKQSPLAKQHAAEHF